MNHLVDLLRGAEAEAPFALGALSHGALWDGAGRVAAALIAAGVRPGDRVAAQVEKSLGVVQLYLGTLLAGAAFLPLNPAYTPHEVGYFLGDAEPAVLVCDPARRAALAPLAGAAVVWEMGADGVLSVPLPGGIGAASPLPGPLGAAVGRGPGDLAAMLYTSGTTGRPKGVMLSHDNLGSNSAALAALWRFTAADRLIHALPLFHTHGLFVAINVTLIAGGALIFHPKFDAEAVLAALPGATAMMGVPTFYTRLLDHPGLSAELCAGMRLFISGSAPLLPETHAAWAARTGHVILERYGMTECSMIASNPYDGDRVAGTVGYALPGVDVRLREAPVGEIEVRGPNVFAGYWRRPDKTAEDIVEGWFRTGDVGRMDPDGRLRIVGRAKDLIICGGFNVYPSEVEAEIDALEGVRESAVIGAPHPDLGEGVVAVVVPLPGAVLEPGALLAALAGRLARFKQPRQVHILPDLPRNAMGKVQKAELRARFAGAFL